MFSWMARGTGTDREVAELLPRFFLLGCPAHVALQRQSVTGDNHRRLGEKSGGRERAPPGFNDSEGQEED